MAPQLGSSTRLRARYVHRCSRISVTKTVYHCHVYLECDVRSSRSDLTALHDPIVLECIRFSDPGSLVRIPCSHGWRALVSTSYIRSHESRLTSSAKDAHNS